MASPDLLGSLKVPKGKKKKLRVFLFKNSFSLKFAASFCQMHCTSLGNPSSLSENRGYQGSSSSPWTLWPVLHTIGQNKSHDTSPIKKSSSIVNPVKHALLSLRCELLTPRKQWIFCFIMLCLPFSRAVEIDTNQSIVVTVLATRLDFHDLCFGHFSIVVFFHSPTLLS